MKIIILTIALAFSFTLMAQDWGLKIQSNQADFLNQVKIGGRVQAISSVSDQDLQDLYLRRTRVNIQYDFSESEKM